MFRRNRNTTRGPRGPEGPFGPTGPMGPQGPEGPTGLAGRDWTTRGATWSPLRDTDTGVILPPSAAHNTDAGVDLQTTHSVVLPPHSVVDAHTGWRVHLAPATVGLVCPRSGLAGTGVTVANAPGVVDSGYEGEVIVRLHNTTGGRIVIPSGHRVAQFLVVPVVPPSSFQTTQPRGSRGLGSTGAGHWAENDLGESVVPGPDPEGTKVTQVEDLPLVQDMVNHPPHYTTHPVFSGECWDNLQYLTPAQYAAGKYIWRWNSKADPTENLEKALWYLAKGLDLAEDGYHTPERLVDHDPTRYTRLDLELTEATNHVLEYPDDGLYSAGDLYTATAYVLLCAGDLEGAQTNVRAAVTHLMDNQ